MPYGPSNLLQHRPSAMQFDVSNERVCASGTMVDACAPASCARLVAPTGSEKRTTRSVLGTLYPLTHSLTSCRHPSLAAANSKSALEEHARC
eukprot:6181809-Pleurochrysis_carterae.AAC.4